MKLTYVIPSHKRAGRVTTIKFIPDAIICVPESQYDEYERMHPESNIVAHPDEVRGISPKRQWIYEKWGNVVMIDDDLYGVHMLYKGRNEEYRLNDFKIVKELLQDYADASKRIGYKLVGLHCSGRMMDYPSMQFVSANRVIYAGIMMLLEDDRLYFPKHEWFLCEDDWIFLLSVYHNRVTIKDYRIGLTFKDTSHNVGGCADFRTPEKIKRSIEYIKKHFGEDVIKMRPNKKYTENMAKTRVPI